MYVCPHISSEITEPSNLIGRDILSPFSEISGDIAKILEFVPNNNIFHTLAKFQVCTLASSSINSAQTNKQKIIEFWYIRFLL